MIQLLDYKKSGAFLSLTGRVCNCAGLKQRRKNIILGNMLKEIFQMFFHM